MPTTIKPCLCGGKAEHDSDGFMWDHCHWVSCLKCGAIGPAVDSGDYEIQKTYNELRALAIRKWNHRKRPSGGEGE